MSERLALERFREIVGRDDFPLDVAALQIGAWDHLDHPDHPDHVATSLARLDDLAEDAIDDVHRATSAIGRARAISAALFDRAGFVGNTDDYYDPRNSFLTDVLMRKTGIPITLSVLYLEVARRIGVIAQGVNFPGHFLVRVATEDAWLFVDPFAHGRLLSPADLEALLRRTTTPTAVLEPSVVAPASKRQIVARMLVNLAGIYGRTGDLPRSLDVLEYLAVLEPSNSRIARDLAQLRERVDALN
ncbi:MAG: transglutaminase-like domain-containing protein [Proteobacteria bacterium]|nr:transglutaminase-like domain-containing protein [Pseudomonadota bacterium]